MSRTLSIQDEKNAIEIPNFGTTYSAWPGVPTASVKGYGLGSWALNKATGVWYRNTGSFTSATWSALDGGLDLSALTATATELNQLHSQAQPLFVSGNAPVVVNAASLTLTPAAHAGRLVVLSGATANAGVAITPPAMTGTGDIYTIVFGSTVTSNTTTLDLKAATPTTGVFYGWLQTYKATTFTPYITASNSNLMTFDGSTRGGIKGDRIRIIDAATDVALIEGFTNQTGTIATPFSNH